MLWWPQFVVSEDGGDAGSRERRRVQRGRKRREREERGYGERVGCSRAYPSISRRVFACSLDSPRSFISAPHKSSVPFPRHLHRPSVTLPPPPPPNRHSYCHPAPSAAASLQPCVRPTSACITQLQPLSRPAPPRPAPPVPASATPSQTRCSIRLCAVSGSLLACERPLSCRWRWHCPRFPFPVVPNNRRTPARMRVDHRKLPPT
ncbi:hypothetical protein BC834DRAFT_525681 [Gloeopeniophorella convolvens]|nr:hypothetical protein BC834DRAFT_525681 [Gloeopeniophorella convolvens]